MFKSQGGNEFLMVILLMILALALPVMVVLSASSARSSALGIPLEFKDVKRGIQYKLIERLSSRTQGSLSVVREEKTEKIIKNLPESVKTGDTFIVNGDKGDVFLKKVE